MASNFFINTSNEQVTNNDKIERNFLSVVIVLHTFIILLGIFGNSVVIYLVLFNDRLRNVRNAFMLNLTFSNLLLVTICTPSFLFTLVFPEWIMGQFWCKFLHSIQIVITLVCAFSIMMIAIDRWMFVVYARSRQFSSTDATIVIVLIWATAILLSMPTFINRYTKSLYDQSFITKLQEFKDIMKYSPSIPSPIINVPTQPGKFTNIQDNSIYNSDTTNYGQTGNYSIFALENSSVNSIEVFNQAEPFDLEALNYKLTADNKIYCLEDWREPNLKRIYILILFVLEFVLPCICMLTTYIWIVRFLKVQDDKMSHYEVLRKKLIQKERPHQKNCKLLSALCITFIICCLPLSLFNIKAEFDIDTLTKEKEIYSPLTVLTTLEVLNTILSPLLYGWMNHNFRIEINKKLKLIKKKYERSTDQNGKTTEETMLKYSIQNCDKTVTIIKKPFNV